ncbi:MAG: alpha-L-fucosidase [Rikenellaceae bacterium]|nr:alpha-L-fucosidase [Rikenellaceae bacterium]
MKNILLTFLACGCLSTASTRPTYLPDWQSIDSRPVPAWFEDAKFGIFIHWGLYSVPAWAPVGMYSEWYWWYKDHQKMNEFIDFHNLHYGGKTAYQDFVEGFTAELFDPAQWAEMFADAGARYVVLTSKHHDGFALWPSAQAWNWNSVDLSPHRDICGELTAAVREKGLKMGFYYSLYEWFNPDYLNDMERFVDYHMTPQLKDLIVRYEPDIVWPDGEWEHPSSTWKSTEFLAWLYNESPVAGTVAVNDRWGKETRGVHGGYYTTEYDHLPPTHAGNFAHPWEECRGIGGSFGFNRNENLEDYNSGAALIRMLIDKTARGGCLLLNVGPTADGRIPVVMQQRLAETGRWLNVNGQAIYGTRKWDKAPAIDEKTTVFHTVKDGNLYVICTRWPDEEIVVNGISGWPQVEMLGTDAVVESRQTANGISISPPTISPGNLPCDHAWVFKISGAEI